MHHFVSEVEKFFHDTIKNEKLGKKSQEHKQLILDKLTKIFDENPYLKILPQDTGKGTTLKVPKFLNTHLLDCKHSKIQTKGFYHDVM